MASKIATMPLEKLLEMRTAVDAEIMARSGGSGSGSGAAKKAKKPKRASQGSAWADFTQMIVKEKADEYTAFKEASESKLGVAPRFVAAYRKAHEAEWEAFQTTWNAEHPKAAKGSVASAAEESASAAEESASADEGSVTSGASEKAASGKRRGPKKLADMTPEERTAHDAAVQKRREAKKAPSAAAEEEAKAAAPVVVVAAPVAAPAPKPVAAPAPKPVAAPVAEEEAEEEGVEQRIFTLDGQKYIRLWDSGAEDWATGDLWAVKANGSGSPQRDYYCGELMEDGSINTDAEEPELD
jgi:hypothetical protein